MNILSGFWMLLAVMLVLALNDREREQYENEIGDGEI